MIRLERLHLMSQAKMLKPMRAFVRKLAIKIGCTDKALDCLVLAINEACMNVIQHAYNGQDDKEIIIEFWKDKSQLIIKILDTADVVDVELIKSRALEDIRPGGLGVHLIKQVMDSVEYKNREDMLGNMLEMHKDINAQLFCSLEKN